MNLKINRNKLYTLLEQVPSCSSPILAGYQGDVSDYLIKYYLLPFFRGSQPTIGELDFSKFTSDDVENLKRYLEFISDTGGMLAHMMASFSKIAPLPLVGQRAFC